MFPQLSEVAWAVHSALGAATAIDFVLAGAMCYYLTKSRITESPLNSKISRIMQFTLSSGLLTSACSLSALFTYIFLANTMIFFAIESLLTKFYVVSFFAMLNARERTTEKSDSEAQRSWGTSSFTHFSRFPSTPSSRRSPSKRFIAFATSPATEKFQQPFLSNSDESLYSRYSASSTLGLSQPPRSAQTEHFTALPNPRALPRLRIDPKMRESTSPITPTLASNRTPYMDQW